MHPRLWSFAAGLEGDYLITSVVAVCGEGLPVAPHLHVQQGQPPIDSPSHAFVLSGVVSNERYTQAAEKGRLVSAQAAIGRPEAERGALIPIKKSDAWWALSQDERRAIFEERSNHIQLGMRALPQVARRLHHCRDLATPQPFDFLTWFDFRAEHEAVFDDLLGALRATEEWKYVEREVDIRLDVRRSSR